MPPKALYVCRRRWTLVFSAPFALFMLGLCCWCLYLLFGSTESLVKLIGGVGAFGTFCIGGTVGNAALAAWRDREPAVVIDARGLDDRRDEGFIPWDAIDKVWLDAYEHRIRVNLARNLDGSPRGLGSTTRRLVAGSDRTVVLHGLSYNIQEVERLLAVHHGKSRSRGANP